MPVDRQPATMSAGRKSSTTGGDWKLKLQTAPPTRLPVRSNSTAPALAFVHVDNPMQAKDQKTQRKIRRHVMKNHGQARKRNLIHLVQAVDDAVNAAKSNLADSKDMIPLCRAPYWRNVDICKNFRLLFRGLDMVSEGLLSLTIDDAAPEFRSQLDETLLQAYYSKGKPRPIRALNGLKQYTESLALVQTSISTDALASHYVIIGTIICLAYFDMRVRNIDRYMVHMYGLQDVVDLCGGAEALDSHLAIRHSLFLADVVGCLVCDLPPRFSRPQTLSPFGAMDHNSPFEYTPATVSKSAIQCVARLAALLNLVPKEGMDLITIDLLMPLCTLAHDILSLPRYDRQVTSPSSFYSTSAVSEVVRISALSLVSTVTVTISGDEMYSPMRPRAADRSLLEMADEEGWNGQDQLRLWAFATQTLLERGENRKWCLDHIVHSMKKLSLRTWDDLADCLGNIAWVEHAALDDNKQLRADIEQLLTPQHRPD